VAVGANGRNPDRAVAPLHGSSTARRSWQGHFMAPLPVGTPL